MIKGIPVKLYERTASGTDTFGHPFMGRHHSMKE